MSELPYLIKDLALILVVASVVTILFKRLKQPLVLGYVVAGFLVSPHMPYTMSVVDLADIQTWADIGVMFLLFSLGLDFSFKKILRMGSSPVIATCCIVFSMIALGIIVGKAFGWSQMDCIFLGGMLAMSSTTIIYKAFDDLGLRQQRFAGMVMSVLILEDMLAIVLMVMLTAIAGGGAGGAQMIGSIVKIAFFLILWFVVGIFALPWMLRSMRRFINNETLLIIALGLCCAMAVISTQAGFSSAFGAFVMGSILAETVEAERIVRLVEPVKNLFGAVFFVSVGMLVQPQIIVDYALPILLLVITIIAGQTVLGSLGFLISGQTLRAALQCGFSMAQIGEFSFIIASLGLALGVIADFLYPVVVAVSVITTFLTPYMIKASQPAYNILESRLPARWITVLNGLTIGGDTPHAAAHNRSTRATWHRLLTAMARATTVYVILSVAAIALMLSLVLPHMRQALPYSFNVLSVTIALPDIICLLITMAIIAPFLRSMVMKKNRSDEFRTLWDGSTANRLPLIVTILVRALIAVNMVFYVCYRLTHFASAVIICIAIVAVVLMVLSRKLKQRSLAIEQMFMQNLRSREIKAELSGEKRPVYERHLLDRDIHIADFQLPDNSLWAGQTLAQLQLRNRFGVNVSSIIRQGQRINIPGGRQMLFPGDTLQVIGSDRQLARLNSCMAGELRPDDPDIEQREMRLHQLTITDNSPLNGKTMHECGLRAKHRCMAVGLEQQQENLSPVEPSYQFKTGDILWLVGEQQAINSLQ